LLDFQYRTRAFLSFSITAPITSYKLLKPHTAELSIFFQGKVAIAFYSKKLHLGYFAV